MFDICMCYMFPIQMFLTDRDGRDCVYLKAQTRSVLVERIQMFSVAESPEGAVVIVWSKRAPLCGADVTSCTVS